MTGTQVRIPVQLRGQQVTLVARLGPPEPDVGLIGPIVLSCHAVDPDGVLIAPTTEEVHQLSGRLARAYYTHEEESST